MPSSKPSPSDLTEWRSPSTIPLLQDEDVHIWRSPLECSEAILQSYWQTLSPDERARAERFKFDHHRQRFIAARGTLRRLLGHYLAIAPDQIQFRYTPQGKPWVEGPVIEGQMIEGQTSALTRSLHFNVSHSETLALYGFTYAGAVGVDVEHIRPMSDAESLAQRFFTAREHATLTALPPESRLLAFFHGWTRKEAYLKATGEGLAGLQQVEVSLHPDEPARLMRLHPDGDSAPTTAWSLYSLQPESDYVGAIAIHHPTVERIASLLTLTWPW